MRTCGPVAERAPEARVLLWARIAGLAYIVIIAIGVVAEGVVSSALVVEADPSATVANIAAHPMLFRGSAFAVLVLYVLVLVLSVALYEVLRSVDRSIALLGLVFRSAEGIVGVCTVLFSLLVLQLTTGEGASEIATAARHALAWSFLDARAASMDVVLLLIGIGGTAYCYLFYRSHHIPAWLAGWGVVTYLSMMVLATVSFLFPDHPGWLEAVFYGPGTVFEVLIGLWLSIKGVDPSRAGAGSLAARSRG